MNGERHRRDACATQTPPHAGTGFGCGWIWAALAATAQPGAGPAGSQGVREAEREGFEPSCA